MNKKIIFLTIIIGFLLTGFMAKCFAQAPQTFEEAKTLAQKILFGLPEALKNPWQEALAIWNKMANWFKNIWDSYIYPWFWNILGKEVEKRKPEIQQEFEKEKQEMKEEIPKATKSLWQRFKELIK